MSQLSELLFNVREKRESILQAIAREREIMAEKQRALKLLHHFMNALTLDEDIPVSEKTLLCYAYCDYEQCAQQGERGAYGLSDQGLQQAINNHRDSIVRSTRVVHSCDLLIEYLERN